MILDLMGDFSMLGLVFATKSEHARLGSTPHNLKSKIVYLKS